MYDCLICHLRNRHYCFIYRTQLYHCFYNCINFSYILIYNNKKDSKEREPQDIHSTNSLNNSNNLTTFNNGTSW